MINMEKTICIDKTQERLYRYYFHLLSIYYKDKEFKEIWIDYVKKMEGCSNFVIQYEEKLLSIDFDIFVGNTVETERKEITYDAFKAVKQFWKDESQWEIKCYDYLNGLAKKHPMIAWFIVTVLLSILLGLLTDVISDGISTGNKIDQSVIVEYMEDEELKMILWDKEAEKLYKVLDNETEFGEN